MLKDEASWSREQMTKVNLIEIITRDYSELEGLLEEELIKNKKNICFLLEIALRYSKHNSFYPYDKIWLKYI